MGYRWANDGLGLKTINETGPIYFGPTLAKFHEKEPSIEELVCFAEIHENGNFLQAVMHSEAKS